MANVVKRVTVSGITEYLRAVEQYKASSLHMFALFTGEVPHTGPPPITSPPHPVEALEQRATPLQFIVHTTA